jgi:hypothetical protein
MEKPWYNDMTSDEDRLYEESVNRIRNAVKQSLSFAQAAELIQMEDEALRNSILDDALKVLIAEMHFTAGKPLKDVARTLKLPLERLQQAKQEMLRDVKGAAVEAYKDSSKKSGNA